MVVLILDSITGDSAADAGFFAHQSESCWSGRRWGHVDRVLTNEVAQSCRGFVSVPGPLQTVQRAELWGVILALQSADAVHVGVVSLGVVRHVGRLLDDCSFATPLELVTDGDLLILIHRMIDDSHVHFFVAGVMKSFDTVDRVFLDKVLSCFGLPGWFRHAYFEYHSHVRLRFKLAAGSTLDSGWWYSTGAPFEYDVYCCIVLALV